MSLVSMKQTIDAALKSFLEEERKTLTTEDVLINQCYTLLKDYALTGGKRLRPQALLLTYHAAGGSDDEKVMPIAIAIELYHTYSLILDDIMDEDDFRRKHPTIHHSLLERFSEVDMPYQGKLFSGNAERLAVSFGVMLSNLTDSLSKRAIHASELTDLNKLKILKLFTDADQELHHGQMMDLAGELPSTSEPTRERYIEMVRNKTGVLFGLTFRLGAMLAHASQDTESTAWQIGMELATGFQIIDDVKDLRGKKGRKKAGDILARKKTLLYIEAMDRADPESRRILQEIYQKDVLETKELRTVIDIMEQSGAVDACRRLAYRSLDIAESLVEEPGLSHDPALRDFLGDTLDEARP